MQLPDFDRLPTLPDFIGAFPFPLALTYDPLKEDVDAQAERFEEVLVDTIKRRGAAEQALDELLERELPAREQREGLLRLSERYPDSESIWVQLADAAGVGLDDQIDYLQRARMLWKNTIEALPHAEQLYGSYGQFLSTRGWLNLSFRLANAHYEAEQYDEALDILVEMQNCDILDFIEAGPQYITLLLILEEYDQARQALLDYPRLLLANGWLALYLDVREAGRRWTPELKARLLDLHREEPTVLETLFFLLDPKRDEADEVASDRDEGPSVARLLHFLLSDVDEASAEAFVQFPLPDAPSRVDPAEIRRDQERLQRALAEQNFETEADVAAFMDQFVGKRISDVLGPDAGPQTDEEKAEALAREAFDAGKSRYRQLAEDALALDPDCSTAYRALGKYETADSAALDYAEKAVAAARRKLAETEDLEALRGHYWGVYHTRPYMEALYDLAIMQTLNGRYDDAIDNLEELLSLNPNDNQAARFDLAAMYLRQKELSAYRELRDEYDGNSAHAEHFWLFLNAVYAHLRLGGGKALKTLKRAKRANRHVGVLLGNIDSLSDSLPTHYTPGSEEEAKLILFKLLVATNTHGPTQDWLFRYLAR